jgi:crotonobetainyl-CoA:carnitine CoA-transferase CaiB-like acyl-CoA transferase
MTKAPLDGVKVLDLSRAVAGPFCTLMLGDLGARVIKIEEPGSGDETRTWGPPFVEGESAYFLSLNRNKESVALDFKREEDRRLLDALVRECDVVVQNFRPGVPERLGIDYESLRRQKPGLIYVSISGFGLSGPDRERPGYDLIIQAMSGMMRASGTPGEPAKSCFPAADVLAGHTASQAVLAALYAKQRTGEGTHIEVSLLESLLFAMSLHTTASLLTGVTPEPHGTSHPSIVPYQLLRCADDLLAVAVPNQRIWRRFCEALGKLEWLEDARYRTNRDRITYRETLIGEIEEIMKRRPSSEWVRLLDKNGVPCGPLLAVSDIVQAPQMVARNSIATMEHPNVGALRLLANPIRFQNYGMEYRTPPTLGQHTSSVREEFLR